MWTTAHASEWEAVCEALASPSLLAFIDERKDTNMAAEASAISIGASLLQKHGSDWHPVLYASRTLTYSKTWYSQIEKGTLRIVSPCEKFHKFRYDHKIIETDNRPLVAIAKKNVGEMPSRLQRFLLRLLMYNYDM